MISDIVDLEPMDKLQSDLAVLRNNKVKKRMPGYAEYKERIKDYYARLDNVKNPIFSQIERYYTDKINKSEYMDRTTKDEPPLLSKFERFRVVNGNFETLLFAEPIFYRACAQHSKNAETRYVDAETKDELPLKLDEIYQERASSITMGAACLEAYLNTIGNEDFKDLWEDYERVDYLKKWKLYFTQLGKKDRFELGKEPFQLLSQLKTKRDYLMHYKPHFCKMKPFEGHRILTETEIQLNREFVRDLPDKIGALVREVASIAGKPTPYWVEVDFTEI